MQARPLASLPVSSDQLNNALGIQSLPSLIPLMQAELFIIKTCWREALDIISTYFEQTESEGQKRLLPKLLAQRAWCHANLGEIDNCIRYASAAANSVSECKDLDDLVVLHARLSNVGRLTRDLKMEATNNSIALKYMQDFESQQGKIVEILNNAIARM